MEASRKHLGTIITTRSKYPSHSLSREDVAFLSLYAKQQNIFVYKALIHPNYRKPIVFKALTVTHTVGSHVSEHESSYKIIKSQELVNLPAKDLWSKVGHQKFMVKLSKPHNLILCVESAYTFIEKSYTVKTRLKSILNAMTLVTIQPF